MQNYQIKQLYDTWLLICMFDVVSGTDAIEW